MNSGGRGKSKSASDIRQREGVTARPITTRQQLISVERPARPGEKPAAQRSLRSEVIFIVLIAVTVVLCVSQWIDSALSQRALERDATDRAMLADRVVDSLWDQHDWAGLSAILNALVGNHREILDVEVLTLEHDTPTIVVNTRGSGNHPAAKPHSQSDIRRLEMPIRRNGVVVGAVRTQVSLAVASALKSQLTRIDIMMLAASIIALCGTLAWFFARRVSRPIAALVQGMRAAEAGGLAVRVPAQSTVEFDYLVGSFNRMLSRVENLTQSLESRVRRATLDLATRNLELREANAHLRTAQLEAARSERFAAIGQMAASLAHDLGTPLNSVLGYTQLLRRAHLGQEHDAKLEIVESQVRRMIETMRNLLDRTSDSAPRRASIQVPALISDAAEIVASRVESGGIELTWEIAPDVPAVSGDPVALRQLLVNLMVNAIDVLPPFGTIHVAASVVQEGARFLEISVADNGPGIEEHHLPHLFEPFYTTKSPDRGTGLGLAIVQRVARAHGGSVLVESAPGQGTTMRVRLPLEKV
jgi:signal transduction histidine kinase